MTSAEPTPRLGIARLLVFTNIGLIAVGVALAASLSGYRLFLDSTWTAALFLLLAFAATALALARTLPGQNVLAASVFIALIASVAEIINIKTSIPFGARTYTDELGWRIFGILPWAMPLVWVVAILNSRGVARLILRPWRKTRSYGFWVIGFTCLFTVIFDFNLEPCASAANSWWIWRMPASVPAWQTAPWVNFLGWAVVTLLILAFTTPWLINKQRARSSPPDYHPLGLWLLLNLLPGIGDAAHHLWLPAILCATLAAIVTIFALRGARW